MELTTRELSQRAGVSVNTIDRIENGRTLRPHPVTVHRLARALDLDSDDELRDRAVA